LNFSRYVINFKLISQWVPGKVLFPEETPLDVPVIQVSTVHGYDLASQYKLGEVAALLKYVFTLIRSLLPALASFHRFRR
jgi:4,5-DOPA dioxygenase extradiol